MPGDENKIGDPTPCAQSEKLPWLVWSELCSCLPPVFCGCNGQVLSKYTRHVRLAGKAAHGRNVYQILAFLPKELLSLAQTAA